MRGRDAARKLTLNANILQVFTIDFSVIQFIVNHNSQSDGKDKSANNWTNLQKKTTHIVSLQRKRKESRTMVSYLEQIRQKWPMKLRSDFRAAVSMKNRLHHESGEQAEEPIHPEQWNWK